MSTGAGHLPQNPRHGGRELRWTTRVVGGCLWRARVATALTAVYAWSVWRAPTDSVQGVIQKILYVHPPLAYGAYLGFAVTGVAGALYRVEPSSVEIRQAASGRALRSFGPGLGGMRRREDLRERGVVEISTR